MTLGDRVAVLRKGVLQQCAAPRELYENPVNLFVAGFIGSPPMNFLPAVVQDGTLQTPLFDLDLSPDAVRGIGARQAVLVGVRPEHVEDRSMVERAKWAQGVTFTARVDVTEWLGDRKYVYLPYDVVHDHAHELEAGLAQLEAELDSERIRSQFVVALDPMSGVSEGADAELWLDRSRVLIFDPESGDNITHAEIDVRAARPPQRSEDKAERSSMQSPQASLRP
jgi:multiple sugar transport system ATP-binding protein